jgi:hypothetical protein
MSDATAVHRIDQPGLAAEAMPDLSSIAKEVGGAWPKGWYAAEIIEGYQAKAYTFDTSDNPSRGGDSRNLRIALKLSGGPDGATRNTFYSQNYRVDDLTEANVARVAAGEADTRLRIALSSLGQIQKAVGFSFKKHPMGHLNPTPLVGQKVDVRLSVNEETGYNDVSAFAPYGTRTGRK